jgi:coenzyme F420-reducing hydrogenase gamma subunit
MVGHGIPCLGPVTQAGCGAVCPAYNRGCFGCFGPKESPNTASLSGKFYEMGISAEDMVRKFRGFNAYAEPFRRESEIHEYRPLDE